MYVVVCHQGIIWGLGATIQEAEQDGERWMAESHSDFESYLDPREITDEQAKRVEAGVIEWKDLVDTSGTAT